MSILYNYVYWSSTGVLVVYTLSCLKCLLPLHIELFNIQYSILLDFEK